VFFKLNKDRKIQPNSHTISLMNSRKNSFSFTKVNTPEGSKEISRIEGRKLSVFEISKRSVSELDKNSTHDLTRKRRGINSFSLLCKRCQEENDNGSRKVAK
jgi:hypothetical protein